MIAVKIWLLVLSSTVNGGEHISVQPQMYQTAQDCEQVGKNLPSARSAGNYFLSYRCVQTNVMVPK